MDIYTRNLQLLPVVSFLLCLLTVLPLYGLIPVEHEISVQIHHVAFGCYHSSILIIPRHQEKYAQDTRFQHTFKENGKEYRYATIGSSFGISGRLVSNVNRITDLNLSRKVEFAEVNLAGAEADKIIALLFEKDSCYKDNLDYDIFPAKTAAEQHWYLADDSYNSNSYVSGLLTCLELKVPELTHRVPGYNKPVPGVHFDCSASGKG